MTWRAMSVRPYVEAIALTVLIAMSCDYCLHLADTFLACRSRSRCKRVRVGPARLCSPRGHPTCMNPRF